MRQWLQNPEPWPERGPRDATEDQKYIDFPTSRRERGTSPLPPGTLSKVWVTKAEPFSCYFSEHAYQRQHHRKKATHLCHPPPGTSKEARGFQQRSWGSAHQDQNQDPPLEWRSVCRNWGNLVAGRGCSGQWNLQGTWAVEGEEPGRAGCWEPR